MKIFFVSTHVSIQMAVKAHKYGAVDTHMQSILRGVITELSHKYGGLEKLNLS